MVRVPPRGPVPLSAWLEQVVTLPGGLASDPGPPRLHPYQRSIADAIGNPKIERVRLSSRRALASRRWSSVRSRTSSDRVTAAANCYR
jgi:hypothetical protein